MTQIKLEVGKKYRNRIGEVVEIARECDITKSRKRFSAVQGVFRYLENGKLYFEKHNDCVFDLIQEVIEAPVKKPHKHAELIKQWADGAEIQVKSDGKWRIFDNRYDAWFEHFEYRIKPQEVPQWRKDLAEKMKAGGVLEFRITQDSYWMPASADINDVLDAECGMHESQYRIKPEPKPDVVEFYVKFPNDALVLHGADFEWVSENGKKCPQLKVIWDSEGNLKDAEVLK